MLTTAPSPTLQSTRHSASFPSYPRRSHYESPHRSPIAATSPLNPCTGDLLQRATSKHTSSPSTSEKSASKQSQPYSAGAGDTKTNSRPRMVNAATQYSPPAEPYLGPESSVPTASITQPSLRETKSDNSQSLIFQSDHMESDLQTAQMTDSLSSSTTESPLGRGKRPATDQVDTRDSANQSQESLPDGDGFAATNKRLRPEKPAVRLMPVQYETCNPQDLVIIIASMLMELIRYNDAIALRDGHLTRFHSRAPPGISVLDYLQRLTTHATLSPPILLSMVFYIDRLCALYPSFTISSLTVHRFLITSATVASKGLSDSFWTNKLYARVGGVSLKELALLELEFLGRIEWRIVPRPEVLVDYYRSLVERSEGFEMESSAQEDQKEETSLKMNF